MTTSRRLPRRTVLALCAGLALTGCAGLGDGFVTASVRAGDDPRELAFAWQLRGPAERVRVEAEADRASGFVPVDVDGDGDADRADEIPAGARGVELSIPLHTTDFARVRYRLVALDATGTALHRSRPLAIGGLAIEPLIGYFKSADVQPGGRFGARVALAADGDTLAVGAPGEAGDASGGRGGTAPLAGAVHVFRRDPGGGWSHAARLRGTDSGAGSLFGASLALSADGRTLVAGAPGEDGPDDAGALPWAGAAYVFSRGPGGAWTRQARLGASNPGALDSFGARLALSADGDTLAVGAWGEDSDATGIDGSGTDFDANAGVFERGAGAVYVFARDANGGWSQQAYVKAANAGANDWFGDSVALSAEGDVLAVGASKVDGAAGADDDAAPDAGAVYLFARAGGAWSQQAYLKAPQPAAGDGLGVSVALSAAGTTLAAGAWGDDGAGVDAGTVHVFARDPAGVWTWQARLRAANAGPGDAFGARVALSAAGDTLAVGAWGEDGDATGVGGPDNDNAGDAGPFPASAGAVYVFVRPAAGRWTEWAYVKAANTAPGDVFGDSVSLSADGNVLAVGASNEDGAGDPVGAPERNAVDAAGAAYLY